MPTWRKGDWIVYLANSRRPIFQAGADPESTAEGWYYGGTPAHLFRPAAPEDCRRHLERLQRQAWGVYHDAKEMCRAIGELQPHLPIVLDGWPDTGDLEQPAFAFVG